jgi:hypothetical protein
MEWRLFPKGTVPEYTTPKWYAERDAAHHLEEALHVGRLTRAASYVREAIAAGVTTVVDVGAGDGGLLSLLPDTVTAWGYDLQSSNVEHAAQRGVNVALADVLSDPIVWAELVVATEMLEHLIDPHGFLRHVASQRDVEWLVCSSPVDETDVSHYGYHTWAWDMPGYRELVRQAGFDIILEHERVGMFQVLMATR